MYTIIHHAEDLIDEWGHGFSTFNAQVVENFRSRLNKLDQRHHVKDTKYNPIFAEGLLATVSEVTALSI